MLGEHVMVVFAHNVAAIAIYTDGEQLAAIIVIMSESTQYTLLKNYLASLFI